MRSSSAWPEGLLFAVTRRYPLPVAFTVGVFFLYVLSKALPLERAASIVFVRHPTDGKAHPSRATILRSGTKGIAP